MTFNPKWLVGKTIARVEPQSWRDQRGIHYNPTIVFTDGSCLAFIATETEDGDGYGVTPLYIPASRSKHAASAAKGA